MCCIWWNVKAVTQELSKLISVITTGSREEVKKAQREVERVYDRALETPGRRGLRKYSIFVEALRDFDDIKDVDHQAYFVNTLRWVFMAVGEQYFAECSQFVLKTIQHPSGKVRQAVIHVASWLVIATSSPFSSDSMKGKDCELAQKLVDQLCRFVFDVEQLLERYEEPKYRRYKYVQNLPPSVYKSLQKLLTEELLRGPYYEGLYEDYLERRGLSSIERLPSRNNSVGPLMSLMQMSFMGDEKNLEFQQRKIRRRLERLLHDTLSGGV